MTGQPQSQPPDPADLNHALKHALRHGAQAARLAHHSPGLVDLLTPASPTADHTQQPSVLRRAYYAEQIIRAALNEIGGESAAALAIIFELTRAGRKESLEQRRKRAARRLGIQPDTFRRPQHEGVLILELAMQIYALMQDNNHAQKTHPA